MKIFSKFTCVFLALCVSLFSACSESDNEQSEAVEEITEELTEKVPESKAKITPCMFVQHEIADYQVWKKGFAEHASVRKKYGLKVLNVFRLKEDTNNIIFILEVRDFKAAYKYAASPELEEAMEKLSVIGNPITKMLNATQYPAAEEKTTFMLIQHRVKDYKIWKKGFDNNASVRQEYGLYALNVFSLDGNPNNVLVLMEVESFEAAMKYFLSQNVKEAMMKLGLVGNVEITPVISVL